MLTPAYKELDFTNQKQSFTASFSQKVSWIITLRGDISGAVKTISGLSDHIDASNSSWGGEQNEGVFFQAEKVTATLSFLGSAGNYATNFEITTPKVYEEALNMGNGFDPEGNLYGPVYPDAGDKFEYGIVEAGIQGRHAFKMSGTDFGKNYYLGVYRSDYSGAEKLPATPENVYFNVYVFGKGDADSKLKLAGKEDDDLSGKYDDQTDDSWEFEIPLSHVGWKMISVKYSDFKISGEKNYGGSGNQTFEPQKLVNVDFALISGKPGGSAEAMFDFPSVTANAPFRP
jgi:hypothetical protein